MLFLTTFALRIHRMVRNKQQRGEFKPNIHQDRVYTGHEDGYSNKIEKKHRNSFMKWITAHDAGSRSRNGSDNKSHYFQWESKVLTSLTLIPF